MVIGKLKKKHLVMYIYGHHYYVVCIHIMCMCVYVHSAQHQGLLCEMDSDDENVRVLHSVIVEGLCV